MITTDRSRSTDQALSDAIALLRDAWQPWLKGIALYVGATAVLGTAFFLAWLHLDLCYLLPAATYLDAGFSPADVAAQYAPSLGSTIATGATFVLYLVAKIWCIGAMAQQIAIRLRHDAFQPIRWEPRQCLRALGTGLYRVCRHLGRHLGLLVIAFIGLSALALVAFTPEMILMIAMQASAIGALMGDATAIPTYAWVTVAIATPISIATLLLVTHYFLWALALRSVRRK